MSISSSSFQILAPVLVMIGITIGAVLAYLSTRSRQASRLTLELIKCNEEARFDALEFLERIWPKLAEAGFSGLRWHANWYGGERWGESGKLTAAEFTRQLEATDIRLRISLFLPPTRGENRYFHSALAETLFLLLQCDLWVKTGSVAAATTQLSKFSLFLRHDLKNFAHYVELLDDQISACPAENAVPLLHRLQKTTPLLRERARRLLRTLQGYGTEKNAEEQLILPQLIAEAANLHGLDIEINGDATLFFFRQPLDSALDNLFKNYADLARQSRQTLPHLQAQIRQTSAGEICINIHDPDAPPIREPERLFEPFWSSSPGGLGIGLYQAKQTLAKHNILLTAFQPSAKGPVFEITFPPGFHAV